MRFESAINVNLEEFQTNLVPYPRIHFPLVTYAPIIDRDRAKFTDTSEAQITYDCFDPESQVQIYSILLSF